MFDGWIINSDIFKRTLYHMLFRYATGCQTLSGAVVSWRGRKHLQPCEYSRIFYVVFVVCKRGRGIAAGKLEKLDTTSKQVHSRFSLFIYI